ncbi:MAG: hypothetical protein AAF310_02300 [Myxococcota bacterium]
MRGGWIYRTICMRWLAVLLLCATSSGCVTTKGYASVYRKAKKPPFGLESRGEFCKQMQLAAVAQQRLGLSQQHTMLHRRCNMLRQQLFAAAVRARRHVTWVWGLPLAWPVHAVTLYSWPAVQTATAATVFQAAKQLEQAYQNNDEQFLAVCTQQLQTQWGKLFAAQQASCT